MKTIRCVIIDQRARVGGKPAEDDIYGYSHYNFTSSNPEYQIEIDIIPPFESLENSYHYFFIADELCDTGFPFFLPRKRRLALLKETPLYILPLNHQFISRNFLFAVTNLKYLPTLHENYKLVPFSSNFLGANASNFHSFLIASHQKRKLCSMIVNLDHDLSKTGYSFRNVAYNVAKQKEFIDIYGSSFNPIDLKLDGLAPYYFSIAMENSKEDFYFTEKIIDCFLTKTIPLYYGCPSISKIFDSRGILHFSDLNELQIILSNLSLDLYHELESYAEINFNIAVNSNFACFKGFLKRTLDLVIKASPPEETPFRLSYSPVSKLFRKFRSLK
ncbi:hypothetical protein KBY72_12165 [Cyanobium sp. BA5m-21]|uniref:glycosyltransferase family 10 domain-containing protein n=1 Tax=unclassified Cyanobium TaxID=2627006 RepID=UPI0020CBE761|nr:MULTISPECIES: glycosyltransferase family 10 [unclassified Cyanobium]MCP9903235.1 hypothetical protein [Cyanobium sp. BA5m-10]MCP9907921.1 hypothetical protein [Cyanobium sp. BA5m-21]